MRKRTIAILVGTLSLFILLSGNLVAQELPSQQEDTQTADVSDKELEDFVDAYAGVQEIQQDINQEITQIVDKSDLSQQEFQNMYQAQTTGNQSAMSDMSESKKQSFSEVMNKVNSLQEEQQDDMVAVIEDYDMSVKRFNNIIAAIQQDSNLYKKFQELSQK